MAAVVRPLGPALPARARRALWGEAGALGAAVCCAHALATYARAVQQPRLVFRGGARMRALLEKHKIPGLYRTFWPAPLLAQRDIAMLVGMKLRERRKKFVTPRRQLLTHEDGGLSSLDWMSVRTAYTRSADPLGEALPPLAPDAPVLLVLHTITANTPERYGLSPLVLAARRRGWQTVVHVRRGCGGLAIKAGARWNPLGCALDLVDAVDAVRAVRPFAPIMLVGISAGSAVLGRYLGEHAAHAGAAASSDASASAAGAVVGAVVIAPGYRMPNAWENVKWPYSAIVTAKLKAHFLTGPRGSSLLAPELAGRPGFQLALEARTLPQLFDRLALACGYETPELYRELCDPYQVKLGHRIPMLAINSLNDPLSTAENIDYAFFSQEDAHDCAALVTIQRGAHIEFYEWRGVGRREWAVPWADEVALDFLASALALGTAPKRAAAA